MELDFLRGFALLGVMLMNVPHFSGWAMRGAESNLAWVLDTLAAGKFISLFSMLFGYGIVMQVGRPDSPLAPYLRRTVGLAVIGLLHGALLFAGDILVTYAIGGVIALAFRGLSAGALLRWALALWVAGFLLSNAYTASVVAAGLSPAELAAYVRDVNTLALGTYGDVTAVRWQQTLTQVGGVWVFLPHLVATFLVGMAAAKFALFSGGVAQEQLLARARRIALPVGLLLAAIATPVAEWLTGVGITVFGQVLAPALAPILAIGYVGLLTPLLRSGALPGLARRTIALGKLGLTNYLMHSVVFSLVFYGYAGGRFMLESYAASAALAACTFGAMLLWSPWWLARFRLGPVEWLLRSITYGRAMPLVRERSREQCS